MPLRKLNTVRQIPEKGTGNDWMGQNGGETGRKKRNSGWENK